MKVSGKLRLLFHQINCLPVNWKIKHWQITFGTPFQFSYVLQKTYLFGATRQIYAILTLQNRNCFGSHFPRKNTVWIVKIKFPIFLYIESVFYWFISLLIQWIIYMPRGTFKLLWIFKNIRSNRSEWPLHV